MSRVSDWLSDLDEAGRNAAAEEDAYRRDFARRVSELADARAIAFRRANLVRALSDALAHAEDEQAAVAHGLAVLRTRLGWSSDSEARAEILARFAHVCEAIFSATDHACFETPDASHPAPQHDEVGSTERRHAEERPEGARLEARTSASPNESLDPTTALAEFESWYHRTKGSRFWILFENVMPETPLVDW